MKIVSAELACCAAKPLQFPKESLPEFAFLGRSNVGKSSLINCLVGKKRLAFTSSTPGRTQQLNFYSINSRFYFVDLPGYGFARVGQSIRNSWQALIEAYLTRRESLRCSVLIVDSRIGPTQQDVRKINWLESLDLPFIIVSTKADKLSKSELRKSLEHTQTFSKGAPVIGFSAVSGLGRDQLWSLLLSRI
ncbi:MAG: ribosome biogenesis GTP-binding protein YihA/YsxC [Acidobacteriota bacterium]